MKLSKYTIFHKYNGKEYIYHQMSKALLQIDNDLENALENNNIDKIPQEIFLSLKTKGFIIDNDLDETIPIKYANILNRYNSESLRITILPTISCNFRCWYCYENHEPSSLKKEDIQKILTFIKNEAINKNIRHLILDWFGGEPLICFDNIIYPISKELKEWSASKDICFYNTITTNGSLINNDRILKMKEIALKQFQITLDGAKQFHNKTRFSSTITNSYDLIVRNIHNICECINDANIELRINYTPQNIDSTPSILNSFDKKIRKNITISPHIVWQKSNYINAISDKVEILRTESFNKGYNIIEQTNSQKCISCYTENMEQFVINHDLYVYKCTARDFDKKYSIGNIDKNGNFNPNNFYYKYFTTPSPFMRNKCLNCELLPSCLYSNSCIQKEIEGFWPECNKELILTSIITDIRNKIRRHEK